MNGGQFVWVCKVFCKFGSTIIFDNGSNGNEIGFVPGNDVCLYAYGIMNWSIVWIC